MSTHLTSVPSQQKDGDCAQLHWFTQLHFWGKLQHNGSVQFICVVDKNSSPFLSSLMISLFQMMYATSPYSDPVLSADLDPQPITDEEEGLIWVVGPVLAVVFIICIVIAILLYKR